MRISTGKSHDCPKQFKIGSAIILLTSFQNVDLTTIVTEQRLTFKSEKSITYLDNVNPYC